MTFFPVFNETIVSHLSCDDIVDRLGNEVFIIDLARPEKTPNRYRFHGVKHGHRWRLSRTLGKSNNFRPMAHIAIETVDTDCLIRISYTLFTSTKRLLVIWSTLSLFLCLFFIVLHEEWMYGIISLSLGLLNYIITRENFRRQVRQTSAALSKYIFYQD